MIILPVADQVAIPIADRNDVYMIADEVVQDNGNGNADRDGILTRADKEHLCCFFNFCDDDLFRYLISGMAVFLTIILLYLMVAEKKKK